MAMIFAFSRNWFALRNTTSWSLALLWSLYFRHLPWVQGLHMCVSLLSSHKLRAWVIWKSLKVVGIKHHGLQYACCSEFFDKELFLKSQMFLFVLFSGNYNCGCVVATSFIFSQTSGSSFDVNINRLLGTCMGLAVGNFPALLSLERWEFKKRKHEIAVFHGISEVFSQKWISKHHISKNKNVSLIFGKSILLRILSGSDADLTSTNYLLRIFMYFVVMFTTWTLAIFGFLAMDSKYFRACLTWAGGLVFGFFSEIKVFSATIGQPDTKKQLEVLHTKAALSGVEMHLG